MKHVYCLYSFACMKHIGSQLVTYISNILIKLFKLIQLNYNFIKIDVVLLSVLTKGCMAIELGEMARKFK